MSRALGRWTLRLMGWRIEGDIPNLPKLVIIVAPHTSNWDFVVGLAAKMSLGLRVLFLGKDSLFRFPLGTLMRAWGGIPVDRATSHDVVSGIVDEFRRRDRLVLAIAPEGTRKAVERWRTGFYHIAHGAGVPIVPVALNFGARAVQVLPPFTTTGDAESDVKQLQRRFDGVRGRRLQESDS
ncbi:MAG TPA: lysophospholipid acyltransferase family protein [Gemmatimonadaceae bacterium]|nr:lysophospholipid acyltransferase family protein [Gemmatimonadaceae bacterium]